jgi:hypothetical protein
MQQYNVVVREDISGGEMSRNASLLSHNDRLTKAAFVSTSSISQGEQVGLLWNEMLNRYQIKIHFAHRTFKWGNEARGNAAVHVVIIGFSNFDITKKQIYDYEDTAGEPHAMSVNRINPYLVDAKDILIHTNSSPICKVPRMIWGNKPTDGGNFLFANETEKNHFLQVQPEANKWIKPFMSGEDLIQSKFRYCLWLKGIDPTELNTLSHVKKRVEEVRKFRLDSKAESTRKKADSPTLFAQIAHSNTNYLAIPEVSSEKRKYIPIGFIDKDVIASNTVQFIPDASLWHFGVITSSIHIVWVKYTCGRLESRYRYSNTIVYNNFPWPENPSGKQVQTVEAAAQNVLDARALFPNASLADLYDPNTMPPVLLKAHQALDKAVDLCYRPQPFVNETKRVEFLFELYDKYTGGMFVEGKKSKKVIKNAKEDDSA